MLMLQIIIRIWRYRIMARNTANVIKGVGAGLLTGILAGAAGAVMLRDNKKWMKKSRKAMSAVQELVDGVREMLS